jgi:glycosyltransferase involved in cell wall biosynthesis
VRIAVASLHPLYDARIEKHLGTLGEAGWSATHYNLSLWDGEVPAPPDGARLVHRNEPSAFGWNVARYLDRLRWFADRIRADGPDLVHLHDLFLLPLAARFEQPVIFDIHDDYRMSVGLAGVFAHLAYARWLPRVAGFVATCPANLPAGDSPGVVVPNHPRRGAAAAASERSAPVGRPVRISYLGEFNTDVRDTALTLDAVEALLNGRNDCTFEFCGSVCGAGTAAVTSRVKALAARFGERFRYLGVLSQAELLRRAAASDIGLVLVRAHTPNRNGGSWNKVYEYLAAGVALVVTSGFDIEDDVRRQNAALVLEPGVSCTEVEAVVSGLLVDRDRLAALQTRARAAAAPYDWDAVARRYLELYERVLGKRTSARRETA